MDQGHSGTQGAAHHAHVHHLSPSPLIVGIGALFTYAGFATGAEDLARGSFTPGVGMLAAGLIVLIAGLLNWVREDVGLWEDRYVDSGVSPGRDLGWWGMMLFLGTELTLFGTLFASFFVARDDAPTVWAAARDHIEHALPLVSVNTAILVASGGTFHWGLHQIRKNNRKSFLWLTAITFLLGATFLAIQMMEYASLIEAGVTLGASQFGSIFYLLTGTHAFHVFLGLCFIGIVFARGWLGQFDAERHIAVDAFAIYWHFVDIVWIVLYLVVYVGVI